jgi:hypothetical protein
MADQDQVNRQENLNELFKDYQKGLTEASEFVGLLTSRTADLVDNYRNLAKTSKQYGENEKQTAAALSQSAKLARSLQAPYDSIKSVSKDLEKSAKTRVQLANSLAAAEGKLSSFQEKSLTRLIQQRKKLAEQQAFEDKIGARLTEKQKQKIDAIEDERLAKERASKELLELERAGFKKDDEVYKRAKAAQQLAEANYNTSIKSLSVDEKKYQRARQLTASTKDQTDELEAQLDPQAKMVLALREALGLHDKTLEYQEEELRRLENIEKAQSYYNMTLGLTADILDKVGAGRLKEAFGLQAGSEAAADAAKRLTDNGKKSLGVFGKLRVLFAGLKGAISAAFSNLMPGALIIKGIIQMVDYFKTGDQLLKEMSGEIMDVATALGISTQNAKNLLETNKEIAYSVGVMPEVFAKQMVELNQAFGTTQKFSEGTTAAFAKLVNLQGLSTEEASNLVKISQLQGQEVGNQVDQYQAEIIALNHVNGTALSVKKVTQDIANTSAATVLTLRGQGKSLGDAAFQANRLGLSMEKLESMSSNLLDFESSIAKEMEAELLIGRDLNLDRAREAALRGDMAGVAAALANEMGSASEFSNLNVLQQEALAEALGMNRDTLAESLKTQELLANTNFDSIDSASKSFQDLLDKGLSVEQARIQFIKSGGTEALAASVSYEKQEEIRQRNMEEAQAKMAEGFLNVVKAFRQIKKEMVELGAEFYTIFLNPSTGFINRLGLGVADVKGSFVDMARGPIMAIGHGINKFVNRLIDFYERYGPDLKTLFLNISDLIMTSTQFVVELVTEFAGLNDELDNADGKFKLGKTTLAGWGEAIKGAIDYIKNLDVKAISDSIHASISQVMNIIENPTLQKFLRAVGVGAVIKTTYDFMLGKSPLTPMFVKVVDGASSLMTGAKNAFTGANGGFAGGTKLGRLGTGLATRLSPGMTAGTTGTAAAGLGAAAGGLAATYFVAQGAYDVAQLDARSTEGESAKAIGGLGGAGGGAALGAAIGTMILPGVGTAIGAGIGAGVGYFGGRAVGAMDEFEDDLDKARKRRIRLMAQSESLTQNLEAQRELKRIDTLNKVYNTLEEVTGTNIDFSKTFTVPKEDLIKAAKKFYAEGSLTSKQFQEVIDGKIDAAQLINITTNNAEITAQTIKNVQDEKREKAQQEAQAKVENAQKVDSTRLGMSIKMADVLGYDAESGKVDTEGSGFEQLENDFSKIFEDQKMLGGLNQLTPENLAEIINPENIGERVRRGKGGYSFELKKETQEGLAKLNDFIIETFDLEKVFKGNEEKINEFVTEVMKSTGTKTEVDDLEDILEKAGAKLNKEKKMLDLAVFNARKAAELEVDIESLNFGEYLEGYEKFYETFNSQISNIQEDGEAANKFVENLMNQLLIANSSENIDLTISEIQQAFDAAAKDGLTKDEFLAALFNTGAGKINPTSMQVTQDGATISNNGPFTITDKFGNAAITHPNDKLVVSPNVSYVNDGISGKGGSVFPVSEKFGALDVQVGKKGVMVQKVEDGFFGNIIDAVKGTFSYLSDPEEILDNILKELGENAGKISAFVKNIFSSNAIKKPLLNNIKKIPVIGKAIDLAFLGYDINKISQEEGISPLEIYQGIGKRLFEFGGGLLGGIGGTTLGGLVSSALTVGTGGAGALLAPLITGSVSLVGSAFGEYLGGQLSTLFDSSSLGQLAWNSLTSQPQLVADGSAFASRGPFTITDKFGATAVTAKGDGVVVSPNISYVEDGITNAAAMDISPNTTVIESDNSKLEQEFAEMKQLMTRFIESVPALASRPINIELDGNKVGQALGQNSYRIN